MKFSDAIRKGAEQTKHALGGLFMPSVEDKTKVRASCALGAGVIGLGKLSEFRDSTTSYIGNHAHPILSINICDLPEELISHKDIQHFTNYIITHPDEPIFVYTMIWNLNDRYNWSRKAIAEWVETIEDYMESISEENVVKAIQDSIESDIEQAIS